MLRVRSTALVSLLLLAGACGDDVVAPAPIAAITAGTGGGGGEGGEGGSGGAPVEPGAGEATAPDETTVVVEFGAPIDADDARADRFSIEGLAIEAVTVGDDPQRAILTTEKQKLGLTYTLTYQSDDGPQERPFLAADTAKFWVADLGSPNFEETEIVARRQEVGDHVVIYVQEGETMADASEVVADFDQTVFPNQTELFRAAPDRDENARIVLLGVDGKGAFGGYFNPIDTFPDSMTFPQWGFHSNEKEMLYLNVENGFVTEAAVVVPHEFSHLLYQEEHPSLFEDWPYHNEGLAECAVNAIRGFHSYALDVYVGDPLGDLANGISLVDWEYSNYSQYVQAYVFWSYVAGQLGGVSGYVELFREGGNPSNVQSFLLEKLGKSFPETQLSALAATWAQAPTGEHGFNGLITLPGKPKLATATAPSLPPLTGIFLSPDSTSVDQPASAGADLAFAGVNGAGEVDLVAPYDVSGGVLVALNGSMDVGGAPQPVGVAPAAMPPPPQAKTGRDRAWLHPPPLNPMRLDRLRRWQQTTRGH